VTPLLVATIVPSGDRVAVIGLGLVGQLVSQLVRTAGGRVVAIDVNAGRLELARSLGAELTLTAGPGVPDLVRELKVTEEAKNEWYRHWCREGLQALERQQRDVAMAFVSGIEGPAEQTDPANAQGLDPGDDRRKRRRRRGA
jgi:threonine dehydrogenase-like Zn-dependent dehydrogenase